MHVTPVQPMGTLYFSAGIERVYTRQHEYLSLSQVLRRLKANALDEDTFTKIYAKLQVYAGAQGRRFPIDKQSYQMRAGKLLKTVELRCYDLSSSSAIAGQPRPYATLRIAVCNDKMVGVRDVI